MSRQNIPLFPLHTVLFPGGVLPLRVFEARYLDMVTDCMKQGSGFGICLIREGDEVGAAATTYEMGTLARVSYFERRADGLLGITVNGEARFRILATEVTPNQLILAEVEVLSPDPRCAVPEHAGDMQSLLGRILDELGYPYARLERRFDDASWLGARLIELLPLALEAKQRLLQLDDPLARLERLKAMLDNGEYS